jgi:hypothetical protein
MPTQIPVRPQYSGRASLRTVCMHALLAAAIIGVIVVTVIWAYS